MSQPPQGVDARRSHDIINAMLRSSIAVSSTLDVSSVLTRLVEQIGQAMEVTSAYIVDWQPETGISTVLAEYYAPEASPAECVSDLGCSYDLSKEFGDDQQWLRTAQPVVRHIDDVGLSDLEREHMMSYGGRSILFIPLVVRNKIIGYAELWESRYRRDFTADEIALCQGIGQQAAIAIENARLFAAERRQLRLAQTLQQVGTILTSSLSLDEVYEHIFDLLAQVVAYDSVSLQLLEESEGKLYLGAGRGFPNEELTRQFVGQITTPSLERVAPPPHWLVIKDTSTDGRWIPAVGFEYIRSWIGAALLIKGRMIGILNVDSATANAYDEETGETVAAFANQAAVAIENARLYEETRRRANELAILHRVALATAAVVDVDELLQQTTEMIAATLYPDVFGFILLDEKKETLISHPSMHGVPLAFAQTPIPLENSVVGLVVQSGEPRIVNNVRQDPLYFGTLPATQSKIAVPLKVHNRLIGVINVESPRANAFSEHDVRFLVTLAGQVAAAIERARLYETLQEQTINLAQEVAQQTAELQAERDRTLTILESAGEGIILAGVEANILYANPAMEHLSGYSREELLGKNPRLLGSGQTPLATYEEMWQTILSGRRWSGEFINRRKDGTLYDAAVTMTPILDPEDKITGFVSVQSDISRLKELDRLKSRFVSNVSHELRTPLTNIKTYLTLLERGRDTRRGRYLSVLYHETDRLAHLIQDLLDLSRLEAEALPDGSAFTDLAPLVNQLFEAFAAKADAKRTQFQLEIPVDLPPVMIEERHLGQLLTNLLGNAFAYTGEQERVTLSAGPENSVGQPMVWISVADTGPGIDLEDMPRLFERFFRGQAAQDKGVPGTGLGLAICKEIVERYHGHIGVKSEPGHGARFTVWLLAAERQSIATQPQLDMSPHQG